MRKEIIDLTEFINDNIKVYYTNIKSKEYNFILNKKKNEIEFSKIIRYLENNRIILSMEDILYLLNNNDIIYRLTLYLFIANHEFIMICGIENLKYNDIIKMFLFGYYQINDISPNRINSEFDKSQISSFAYILSGLNNFHVMSDLEGEKLFREYSLNPSIELRNYILCCNLKLIIYFIKNNPIYSKCYSDLFQDGIIGLTRSIEKFDIFHDNQFATYAFYWIRKSINKSYVKLNNMMSVPQRFPDLELKYKKAYNKLTNKLNREPTIEEIVKESGLNRKYVEDFYYNYFVVDSLDETVDCDDSCTKIDLKADDSIVPLEDLYMRKYYLLLIKNYMQELSYQERITIECRMGFNLDKPLTLEATGRILGVTRERVRQIENTTLKKLRKNSNKNPLLK